MSRPVPDIISTGLELMARMPAPENFKLAAMLTIMSTLLGRRVWMDTDAELPRAYPNLYTMLVAPPGVAKDIVISWVRNALTELQEYVGTQKKVWANAGTSISPKGIYDALGSADHCEQHFRWDSKQHSFRSLTFLIGEMSTIMPDYDQKLIGILNDLYNCGPSAEDRIRGQDVIIPNPHVTMLIGNQPETLFETLPEKAFKMGFTSRLCVFQAHEKVKRKLFKIPGEEDEEWSPPPELRSKFLDALHDVTLMTGSFRPTRDSLYWLNEFAEKDLYAVPGSRWQNYNPRRILHIQKLAMICSASERGDRKLDVDHLERALDIMVGWNRRPKNDPKNPLPWWTKNTPLIGYEKGLPNLFDGVISSEGFSSIFEEVYNLCEKLATPIRVRKHDESEVLSHYEITHYKLSRELSRTTNPHKLEKLFNEMIKSGVLTPKMYKVEGQPPIIMTPRAYIVRVNLQ